MSHPIFITGVERSGAAAVARVLAMTGGVWTGSMNGMYENFRLKQLCQSVVLEYSKTIFPVLEKIPYGNDEFKKDVNYQLFVQGRQAFEETPWMFKHSLSTPLWKIWNDIYPKARWIVVRRKSSEIINSCVKTNWMELCKNTNTLKLIDCVTEEDGWLWWIHQYEAEWKGMVEAGLNITFVWPDRILENDFTQLQDLIKDLGFTWNPKTEEVLKNLIHKK